jgi:hypothetical protein
VTDVSNPVLNTIELINGSPTSRDVVDFRFTFSEMMDNGGGANTLVPGSANLGGVNVEVPTQDIVDGAIVNLAVTLGDPNVDGTVNAWFDSGFDMVGLPLATNFSSAPYTIDNAVPIIWDIVRASGADENQNDVAAVVWTVIFDQEVTGVSSDDFILVGTYLDQTTASAATVITNTAPGVVVEEWNVTVSTGYPSPVISNAGTLRLDTVVAPTIYDLTGGDQLGGPFAGGEQYDIINVPRPPAAVDGTWMMFE